MQIQGVTTSVYCTIKVYKPFLSGTSVEVLGPKADNGVATTCRLGIPPHKTNPLLVSFVMQRREGPLVYDVQRMFSHKVRTVFIIRLFHQENMYMYIPLNPSFI